MNIWEANGTRVFELAPTGPEIGTERSATDIIGDTYGQGIDLVAIPVARLAPGFLDLSTRMAGNFLQKFVTYGFRIAIVGDISDAAEASKALRDFVTESNRGTHVRFARDTGELRQSL